MFALLAVLVPIVDQVTKAIVIRYLPEYESVTIIPGLLAWTHVRNPGAAFGLLPFQRSLFIAVAALLVVAAVVFRRRIFAEPPLVQAALGLGLGGAVGNMIDRLRTGFVTDFIDVPLIPVFNVADTAIVCGVALLLWASFFYKPAGEGTGKDTADPASAQCAPAGAEGERTSDG